MEPFERAAGEHFAVDAARLWDLPDDPVRIGIAVSGDKGVERFAPLADDLIAVEPDESLVEAWNAVDGVAPIGDGAPMM